MPPRQHIMGFDATEDGTYLDVMRQAAESVDRPISLYDQEAAAFIELDMAVQALVVVLRGGKMTHFTGSALLERAYSFDVPRAVITSSADTEWRTSKRDIRLDKDEPKILVPRLVGWLNSIPRVRDNI